MWRCHIRKLKITCPSEVLVSLDKRPYYIGTWRFTMIYLDRVLFFVIKHFWISKLLRCVTWKKGCRVDQKMSYRFKDVRANCFCASLLRTQIHMPRHASSARAMRAIAIALIEFNDLGRSVTPTFIFRNRFNLISTFSKKWTKNQFGKLIKITDFCPQDMESCHLAAARRKKLWSLNANLF